MADETVLRIKERIREEMRDLLGVTMADGGSIDRQALPAQIDGVAHEVCADFGISDENWIGYIIKSTIDDFIGLGPLQPLQDDPKVAEIFIDPVGVEPNGTFITPVARAEVDGQIVACPPNSEGKGEFTMHELLVGALRERPDRIVVGECRDDETYEMLQAMQTGHDGSLTTIHANDCAGAFTRIENMILKSQGNMTMEAIRRQIGAAIDVVVQVKRWRGGYRRIESITAVEGFSDGNVTRNELFHWEGSPENGRHVATGYQPARLKEKILDEDAEYDPRWFEGGVW